MTAGIDWARDDHAVCIVDGRGRQIARTMVEHTAAGLRVTRVRRNFWFLATATVIAIGVLSDAVARPASPSTAALISVSLAGRILVVSSRVAAPRSRRTNGRRRT